MGTQLYLPAGWARQLKSRLDPIERLAELEKDRLQAKGDIREILDRLPVARRYGVAHVLRTVNQALGIAPGSPDGSPFSRTANWQAASAKSQAQGDRLLKAGIKCPPESLPDHWNDLPSPESPLTASRG